MPEGVVDWELQPMPPGVPPNNWYEARSDLEKTLAKGRPFKSWFDLGEYEDGEGMDAIPDSRESTMAWFRSYVQEQAPIDVVCAFSQGAHAVNELLDSVRREASAPPWRLNIFFCPSRH